MPTEKNVFLLDDGTEEIVLKNHFGQEIARLHIRTGDYSIIDRYTALEKEFPKITEPLTKISLKADGTSAFDADWAALKEVERVLIDRLNELFGTDDMAQVFANRNAFSSVGGGYFYAEKVMEVLGQIITKSIEKGAKAAEKRTAKYLKDINNAGPTANNA